MSARLQARGLGRTLDDAGGQAVLVHDVSFAVAPGEFVAILGPSGCGKSSLLYLLGLLDRPSEGDVLIDGQSTITLTRQQRAAMRLETIGFIFQFHFLLPEFSALENVALPMRRLGKLQGPAIEARALHLLTTFGLESVASKRPQQLSGGQRQRVAIARSLANDPQILLCDEPTGNLDSANTEILISTLQHFASVERRTVICVTHDERVAASADRRVRMRDAQVHSDDQASARRG